MSGIQITRLVVGQMQENCYLVKDIKSDGILIIDPGDDASFIVDKINSIGGSPQGILATHGHFDHIMAALELQLIFKLPFLMNADDRFLLDRMSESARHFLQIDIPEKPPVVTRELSESEPIVLGSTSIVVIHTPGHTPGSSCAYIPDEHILFAGDTIFSGGSVGRTDFSYSKPLVLSVSIEKIFKLPQDTVVLPGHGEETTIGDEIRYHMSI